MGKTLMGSTTRQEDIQMLNPQQQQLFSQLLQQGGPSASGALGGLLQGQSPEERQDIFQQTYVQPALQAYEQQVLPAIQQRFADMNAGSSSALNQALAQSASDLSTSLGSNYGQFLQNQQQTQLGALSQFLPFLAQQTFQPQFQQQQGILGPLLGALGNIGAGAATGYFGQTP